MRIAAYTTRPWLKPSLLRILRDAGHAVRSIEVPDAFSTRDDLVVLHGESEEIRTVLETTPWMRFLVVSPTAPTGGSVLRVDTLEDAQRYLRSLREENAADALSERPMPRHKADPKRRYRSSECRYCLKRIAGNKLIQDSHKQACKAKLGKPASLAKTFTVHQRCGRSKGSICCVDLPLDATLNGHHMGRGFHLIADARLQKSLLGWLKKKTRLILNKEHLDTDEETRVLSDQ